MFSSFAKTLVICFLHIVAAYALVFWSLAFLVRWTGVPTVAPLVALFLSLPTLMIGVCYASFDGYRRIPSLAWLGAGMMVSFGIVLLVAVVLSK